MGSIIGFFYFFQVGSIIWIYEGADALSLAYLFAFTVGFLPIKDEEWIIVRRSNPFVRLRNELSSARLPEIEPSQLGLPHLAGRKSAASRE
jgi:hypothetical protein